MQVSTCFIVLETVWSDLVTSCGALCTSRMEVRRFYWLMWEDFLLQHNTMKVVLPPQVKIFFNPRPIWGKRVRVWPLGLHGLYALLSVPYNGPPLHSWELDRRKSFKKKWKALFTSLNYRSSLYFHLKLENRIFCLLELMKLDIWPPWVVFPSGFPIFLLCLFWINLWKIIVKRKKIIK